jgi:hypothetical protein
VEPIVISSIEARWEYQFSFKSSLLAPTEIFHNFEWNCQLPMVPDPKDPLHKPGHPLYPQHAECYNSEAEARVAAQKQADEFEAKYIADGNSTTMIEAKKLWKKIAQ